MAKSGMALIGEMTREQLLRDIRLVNREIMEHVSEAETKRRWVAECRSELTRR